MIGTISLYNNIRTLTINFNDAQTINEIFGLNNDTCNVNNTINNVKQLFENLLIIEDFDYPIPSSEQVRFDYVDEPINMIDITWSNGIRTDPITAIALNQTHRANIFMTYPVINNNMNSIQILSHELGHWFFNRAVEFLIEADERHVTRSDIPGYEDYISEKVAYYCEKMIGGNRVAYHPDHSDIIIEVDDAIQNEINYIAQQLEYAIREWLRDLERERLYRY